MTVTATAKRRRRQARMKNGRKHKRIDLRLVQYLKKKK
jgi:hypothetical protein